MIPFRRGMTATLVVLAGLGAACSSGDGRAPAPATVAPTPSTRTPTTLPPITIATTSSTSSISTTSTSTSSTTTSTTVAPPPSTVALAVDQQVATVEELHALLDDSPPGPLDPEAAVITASIEGALRGVADGSVDADGYFLATGDYLPPGVVVNSYLACPLTIGEPCLATRTHYREFIDRECVGQTIIVAIVEGPLGPVGSGTCVWRPTPEEIDEARDVVGDALTEALDGTVLGAVLPSTDVAHAAQRYAEVHAEHPYEDLHDSDVAGAPEFRAAMDTTGARSWACRATTFAASVDDGDRAARQEQISADITALVEESLRGDEPRSSFTGVGAAIGSGRLVVTACAARP